MADIVQSLFGLTPEAYRQQQMNEADRMALGYAQLTPQQRASFGMARAGYQLGGVLGSALGAQDPMLQLISNRQAVARQIDPTDPETMRAGILALNQAGDTVGAMQLTQLLQERLRSTADIGRLEAAAQASLAAAGRQRTEATPNDVRIAREFAAQKGEPGSPEYNAEFTAQLTRLTTKPEGAGPREVQLANALALRAGPVGSPEYTAAYNAELGRLTTPERAAESTPEIRNATALASQKGQPGSPEFQAEFAAQLARLTTKTEADRPTDAMRNADALALLKGPKGSPEYNAEYSAQLARLTSKAEQRGAAVGTDREAVSLEMFNTTFDKLTPEQRGRVNQRVEAEQGRRAAATAPRVTIAGQEKAINANKAKLAGEVETGALNSEDRITLARNMMSLLPRAFTGLGADVKLGAARVAEAFGIPVTGTTESQIIDQILGQMTIGAAGQLKGALSDKDREFLKQTIGTRGLTRNTLQFVAERIEREARIDAALNKEVNAWQSQNKSLNDFNFVEARTRVSKMIDSEIARYKQLKAKKEGGG